MRPGPELTLFRRKTGLYRKTRTWSHHSPEGISKCNAFILVHNPSQVKATQPYVFEGNRFISVHNPLQSTNTLLSGPKAKQRLTQFREPLPENQVQSKPQNLSGPQKKNKPRQKKIIKGPTPFWLSSVCSQQLSSLRHTASPEAPQKDQINYSKHRLIPGAWTLCSLQDQRKLSASWRGCSASSKGQTQRLRFAEEETNLAANKYAICAIYILSVSLDAHTKVNGPYPAKDKVIARVPVSSSLARLQAELGGRRGVEAWQHHVVFPHKQQ